MLSEHTYSIVINLIVSLRLPAKPCLAVIVDTLFLSLLLPLPLTYLSDIIILPSGSLCGSEFSSSVFAKVKVEIGTKRSCAQSS